MFLRARSTIILIVLLLAGLMAYRLWWAGGISHYGGAKRTIAYVGRFTNAADSIPLDKQKLRPFDLQHEMILREYVEELNEERNGTTLELKTFDNRSDKRTTDSIYRAIALDTNIICVVDNTWGEHLAMGAPVIRDEHLPVIAMNADRGAVDYGRTTMFTGNDDDVPSDIVNLLTKELNVPVVNFISEQDYKLHNGFLTAFTAGNIGIAEQWLLPAQKPQSPEEETQVLERIGAFYRDPAARHIPLVINTHTTWGNRIIQYINTSCDHVTMVAGQYVSSVATTEDFGKGNDNQLYIMSRPNDALSKTIVEDLATFREKRPDLFTSASSAFFVKRCVDVRNILRAGMNAQLVPSRRGFATYFDTIRGKMVASEQELYQFDSSLVLSRDVYFAKYKGGKYYSLGHQFNRSRTMIPNVFFGMDIVDIYNVDVSSNSFKSDFYYWIKVDTAFREEERSVVLSNIISSESSKELVVEKIEEGVLYRLYKVSGKFYIDYELKRFPLDRQEVAIRVESLRPADRLRISFDQKSFEHDSTVFDRFRVPAWNKVRNYISVDNRLSTSLRGDPDDVEGKLREFKTFSFRLFLERKLLGPFLSIILPLLLIGLVGIALLYVKDITFGTIGSVSVGVFLGIIAFSISFSNIIPASNYLTKADLLFWTTFIVVLISFVTVIVLSARYHEHEIEQKHVRPVKIALSVLYPVLMAWILWS